MTKEQAQDMILSLINSAKLTKQERDGLMMALNLLSG